MWFSFITFKVQKVNATWKHLISKFGAYFDIDYRQFSADFDCWTF